MSNYHFVVSRYPIDGILLSMKLVNSSPALLLAPGADGATANYFSVVGAADIGAVLQEKVELPSLNVGGRKMEFAFGCEQAASGLLNRLREQFTEREQILIPLTYDRIEGDLPLLRSGDTVSLFWNSDELLSGRYFECIEYIEERLESEGPNFSGLHFYHSQDVAPLERLEAILEVSSLDTTNYIKIEGGDRWSKACS